MAKEINILSLLNSSITAYINNTDLKISSAFETILQLSSFEDILSPSKTLLSSLDIWELIEPVAE